ncbi:hypothetical protein BKA70DRAFT_1302986 [Coprinopsis sp. MPI-PUGE-AT-0042]|nr:hypothetical protein BKA70DRAFT_1302986 [Coprinopsis sp. MPI-PUGE-AT-0042]
MSICIYLGTESPLIRTIFMDGGIYFAILTLVSLANLFVLIETPDGFQFVLAAYQGVFHSTLTSRMFLNLRELAAKDRGAATDLISRELAVLNIKTAQTATRTTTSLSSVRAWATPTTALPGVSVQNRRFWQFLSRPSSTPEIESLIAGDNKSVFPGGEGEEGEVRD